VIAVAEAIPFAQLTEGSTERLYALKGEIIRRGIAAVLGIEMPVYAKRRFQDGSGVVFRGNEEGYRRHFLALY
jgi:asparagine synthase (glutamine-hydrolysing)